MPNTAVNGRSQEWQGTLRRDGASFDLVRSKISSILSSLERCIKPRVVRTRVVRTGRGTVTSSLHLQQVNHFIQRDGLCYWIRGLSYYSGQAILRSLVVHDHLNLPSSS